MLVPKEPEQLRNCFRAYKSNFLVWHLNVKLVNQPAPSFRTVFRVLPIGHPADSLLSLLVYVFFRLEHPLVSYQLRTAWAV